MPPNEVEAVDDTHRANLGIDVSRGSGCSAPALELPIHLDGNAVRCIEVNASAGRKHIRGGQQVDVIVEEVAKAVVHLAAAEQKIPVRMQMPMGKKAALNAAQDALL